MKNNNKGFTFLEIILAVAILGVISVVLLASMAGQFRWIKYSQNMTVSIAKAQQDTELLIDTVKKGLKDFYDTSDGNSDPKPDNMRSYVISFSDGTTRTIEGYPRTCNTNISFGSNSATLSLFTIVADNKMPELPVASETVSLKFSDNSLVAYQDLSLSVDSTIENFQDPFGVHMSDVYRWYVSRPGFNIPMIANPAELDKGKLYPIFPNDYTIIPGAAGASIPSVLKAYSGKHLICTVTPASFSGKLGMTVVSNPVFVAGLPFTDGLLVDLDASMISETDADDSLRDSIFIENWGDISGNIISASQASKSKQPELIVAETGENIVNGTKYKSYTKLVKFDGAEKSLKTKSIGATDLSNITIFVAARESLTENIIIYRESEPNSPVSIDNNDKLTISTGTTDFSSIEIAEIIVYDRILLKSEVDLIINYLSNKYKHDDSIVPASITLNKNSTTIGTNKTEKLTAIVAPYNAYNRNVVWSSDNTSVATVSDDGTVRGIALGSAIINVRTEVGDLEALCNVTIANIVDVTGVSLNKSITTISADNTETLIATVYPVNSTNKNVTWSTSNEAVASVSSTGIVTAKTAGSAVITVTTADGGKTASCTVTVIINVTGVSINKQNTTIIIDDNETLIATVSPDNATNKNVTWSSNNTSVATVSSSGVVTAKAVGTAVITVTTSDGSKSDNCTVTVVNKPPVCSKVANNGNDNKSFTLTFDKKISAASINVSESKAFTGKNTKNIRFYLSQVPAIGVKMIVNVTASDGSTSQISVWRTGNKTWNYSQP